jgi:hypothetical protein
VDKITFAEDFCDFGRESFWLRPSMIGGRGPCPFFNYTVAFALQLTRRFAGSNPAKDDGF